MKIRTAEEFQAAPLLGCDEPVVITRNGRAEGIYIPMASGAVPREIRRQLFLQLSDAIGEQLEQAGVTEEEVLAEFDASRKAGS